MNEESSGPSRSSLALLAGAALAVFLGGCPVALPTPQLDGLTDAQAVARVHKAAARRLRLAGTVKARLPGLEGAVMSADLDVALEPPARVSVAVRSFFDQPMQMLVTDGSTVTVYDATQGTPVFLRGGVTARTIQKVLPIPLTPAEVVEVFLQRPSGDRGGRLVGVDERAGTYDVWLEAAGHAPAQLTVRAVDDAIVRWQHKKKNGEPLLDVRYQELHAVGDAVLPHAWTLRLVDRQPEQSLVFTAADVTFNGEPLPDSAFQLEPPPGVPVEPL